MPTSNHLRLFYLAKYSSSHNTPHSKVSNGSLSSSQIQTPYLDFQDSTTYTVPALFPTTSLFKSCFSWTGDLLFLEHVTTCSCLSAFSLMLFLCLTISVYSTFKVPYLWNVPSVNFIKLCTLTAPVFLLFIGVRSALFSGPQSAPSQTIIPLSAWLLHSHCSYCSHYPCLCRVKNTASPTVGTFY